nr:fatty acyl-coa reductase [Quercus suber]
MDSDNHQETPSPGSNMRSMQTRQSVEVVRKALAFANHFASAHSSCRLFLPAPCSSSRSASRILDHGCVRRISPDWEMGNDPATIELIQIVSCIMASATAVFRTNATALITGAASGVGLAVAKLCASHSMNLILVDNNNDALSNVKSKLQTSGSVSTHTLDVSSLSAWSSLKSTLDSSHITLDFLHLNAGIGLNGDWTDNAYFQQIFAVNVFGVINGLNTFYPHFANNTTGPQKAIVVTGSKQGITNPPSNPAYNASKSALKTLAEHLSFDLAKSSPHTSVHLLVPGWTFTGFTGANETKTKPDGAWAPEQVADYLYQKMGEGKFYAICPDNDVTWEQDRKRMTWTMGDVVYERLPQSRWREEYKEEANRTMEGMKLGAKQSD